MVGMATFRTITRKELYDLVWSRPMRDVAVEFGISDVGLAKTCARHGIPSPPRGYWARLQAGQKVERQSLARAETENPTIEIVSTTSRLPEAAAKVLAEARIEDLQTREDRPEPEPPAPFPVVDLHRSIKLTALTLRKSRAAKDGAVRACDEGMHGVVISAGLAERAVFFLDGLARRLEKDGIAFEPAGASMRAAIGTDTVSMTLAEKTRRQKHIPTQEELNEEEKERKRFQRRWSQRSLSDLVDLGPYTRPYPEWDIIFLGELVVEIDRSGGDGLRRRWSDGKTQKVERMLDDIALGLRAHLAAVKERRESHEEWQRQYAHMQRRRETARRRAERETRRLAFLKELSDHQQEIARLTEWLAHAGTEQKSPHLDRMNQWVRERLRLSQAALDEAGIESALAKAALFPEADELHDPEGELPKESYNFY
jgi:hypothetical protein